MVYVRQPPVTSVLVVIKIVHISPVMGIFAGIFVALPSRKGFSSQIVGILIPPSAPVSRVQGRAARSP